MFKKIAWRIRTKWILSPGPRRFLMRENPSYSKFHIGDKSYGNPRIHFSGSGAALVVGKYVSVADNVNIMLGGEHRTDWVTTYPLNLYYPEWSTIKGHPSTKGDVIIGNDVWIGRDVIVLSGVSIGDGAVVAAGSVVTKNVAPFSIVGGNPAKHIRFRFPEDVVQTLIRIAWWNWPDEAVSEAVPHLLSDDVAGFIDFYHTKLLTDKVPK